MAGTITHFLVMKKYFERIWKQTTNLLFEPYNFNLSVASANKIVHMTAHNEVRKNFLLTDVRNSMGVHSDVAGGYAI